MNRRALPWIALATLFTAACGDIVRIGSEGEPPAPLPPTDVCLQRLCGEPCAITFCSANECASSEGGFCDLEGHCVIDAPPCPDVDPRCAGLACGAVCNLCDPGNPTCITSVDAGPPTPPLFCDAKQQCQPAMSPCP